VRHAALVRRDIDRACVRAIPANHPGGAVGWRVDDGAGERAIVYLPDNEIAEASGRHGMRRDWIESLRGARLLLHDATYTPDDLPSHRGWGHSSWDEAVRLAVEAGVERLVLFHHHPDRSDAAVDRIVDEARALARSLGSPLRVLAAAEGLVLHV
jgi:ribonuclease BN (tRNA processing enzyme)